MNLPPLTPKTIESDPYRSVVLTNGALIFAECNGSGKDEVAAEIAKRCNHYDEMVKLLKRAQVALNTAPRFHVTPLGNHVSSYDIASQVDAALEKLK